MFVGKMAAEKHNSASAHTVLLTVGAAMTMCFVFAASTLQAASPAGGFAMQVRPRLCVLMPGESVCVMQFSVTWSAPAATDVCLTLAGELAPLQCWQAQRDGEFEMRVERRDSTLVQLRDANNDALLLEEQIPIISRDLRETRTRRRHAWSIL